MNEKPVLCWIGDGPDMSSGFGNELRQFIYHLKDYEHIVIDPYQSKFLVKHNGYRSFSLQRLRMENYTPLKEYNINAVLTFGCLWMAPDVVGIKKLHRRAKWISLYRIDGLPLPKSDLQRLKVDVDKVVVPSIWLEEKLKKQMIGCERISEGISLDLFKKLDENRRKKLREPFDGKLVFGCTNRNIYPRKFYDILLKSFAKFSKDKNDVCLLLHCDHQDREGLPLIYLIELFNLEKKIILSSVRWDMGVKLPDLVDVYNQIDIWTSTTGGEAFGRGNIEALACGCNVIAPEHTSFDELVKGHGLGIKTSNSFFLKNMGYFLEMPSVESVVEQMEKYYRDEELREKHKLIARDFVKDYEIKDIMKRWGECLENWL